MTDEEFRRVRGKLGGEIQQGLKPDEEEAEKTD